MGWQCPPLYGKPNYDAEIEKKEAQIAKLQDEVKELKKLKAEAEDEDKD